MKYSIDTLCLELTRRCNMRCKHCLRGSCQNIDMTPASIDGILKSPLRKINSLVFTGGEPSLVHELIGVARECIKRRRINVFSFYVVTNGKANAEETAVELLRLNAYILRYGDPDAYGGVSVSFDKYHKKIPPENEAIYKSLSFYRDDKDYRKEPHHPLIKEGRAKNIVGARKVPYQPVIELDKYDDWTNVNSLVYIAANGNIVFDCDLSYKNADKFSHGNIRNPGLFPTILKAAEEWKEK